MIDLTNDTYYFLPRSSADWCYHLQIIRKLSRARSQCRIDSLRELDTAGFTSLNLQFRPGSATN